MNGHLGDLLLSKIIDFVATKKHKNFPCFNKKSLRLWIEIKESDPTYYGWKRDLYKL